VREIRNQQIPSSLFLKEEDLVYKDKIYEINTRAQRSFDKSITALKMATSKIASIIENVEDNWIVYEILMQHKNMLNSQIDLLIKEKKKL
jgi:ParB family chromosome partitioning protein